VTATTTAAKATTSNAADTLSDDRVTSAHITVDILDVTAGLAAAAAAAAAAAFLLAYCLMQSVDFGDDAVTLLNGTRVTRQ